MALSDWFSRFWLSTRSDATPLALPALPLARGELRYEVRTDAYGGASVSNPRTFLGSSTDKGTAGRPNPYVLPLDLWELNALYTYNGLARRIVETFPQRACRRGWTVPDMADEDRRLQTHDHVLEALTWAQLYGGSVLIPVTVDDVPPDFRSRPQDWLRQPLDPERVGRIAALQVFDAIEASPVRWDRDPTSPTFRLPSEWRISTEGYQVILHASRVVHLRGAKRPPSLRRGGWSAVTTLPDDSYLQAVWDQLRALSETLNGGATLAQEIRESVLSLAALAASSTGDEANKVDQQLQLIQQGRGILGMTVIGTDDKFESRSNPPTGFKDLSDAAWEALSGATGIPQTILRGDAPSGLSTDGESGHEAFRQLVSGYQEAHRPELERLYAIVYAAQDGPTAPEGWALTFAALDEPDEASMAATRLVVAQMDQINVGLGAYNAAAVAQRFGPDGFLFELPAVSAPPEASLLEAALRERGNLAPIVTALIQTGTATPETMAEVLDLPPPPEPDPAEEAAIAAAQAHLTRTATTGPPADPTADPAAPPDGHSRVREHLRRRRGTPPRADAAADSVVVLIPAADPGLRAAVEAAIGQHLTVEEDPHVTVLYVGQGLPPDAVQEVVEEVGEAVEALDPGPLLAWPTLRAFPPGPDGTPIVLEFSDAYAVGALNGTLLRALAHRITAKQFPTFRAHLTVGYAPAPLSPDAQAALVAIPVDPALRIPVGAVEVRVGDRVVLVAYPGQGPAQNEPNVPMGAK